MIKNYLNTITKLEDKKLVKKKLDKIKLLCIISCLCFIAVLLCIFFIDITFKLIYYIIFATPIFINLKIYQEVSAINIEKV